MIDLIIRSTALFLLSLTLIGCAKMGTKTVPLKVLSEQYANGNSHYVQINGLDIHYQDVGEGPPLLLLHGVNGSLHTWDKWVEQLKDRYRIIRLDLPGFGLTGPDKKSDSQSAAYMVKMIDDFAVKLGLNRFFLAGSSLGGYYAWNYAALHPEKLYKLALIDAIGYPQSMPPGTGFASFPGVRWLTSRMLPKFMLNRTAASAFNDKTLLTKEVKKRNFDLSQRQGNRASYIKHLVNMRTILSDDSVGEKVKDVLVPTLLMWGEEDAWVPIDVMRLFHRDLSYGEYLVYSGVGHLPMEELPVQSARDLNNFFMSEIRKSKTHPQESEIKFYDSQKYEFHMGKNEEL